MKRFMLFKASIRHPEHRIWLCAFFTRRPTRDEFRTALRKDYPEVNGVNFLTEALLDRLNEGGYAVDEQQGYWDNR